MESSVFLVVSIAFGPVTWHNWEETASLFFADSLQEFKYINDMPSSFQAFSFQGSLSLSWLERCSRLLMFVALCWTLQYAHVYVHLFFRSGLLLQVSLKELISTYDDDDGRKQITARWTKLLQSESQLTGKRLNLMYFTPYPDLIFGMAFCCCLFPIPPSHYFSQSSLYHCRKKILFICKSHICKST